MLDNNIPLVYTYSLCTSYIFQGASGSKPTVTTSMSDSAAYAGATGGTTAKGATGGTTATKGATGGTTATKGATGGATATKGATGGTTAKGATGGATGMGYSTKQPWSTRSTESGTASRSVPSHPDPPPPHPSSSASLYTASSNAGMEKTYLHLYSAIIIRVCIVLCRGCSG